MSQQTRTAQPDVALKLLAIDDDPEILAVIGLALEHESFEILTAADSDEGLALFFEKRPQVVLVDLTMPHIDGMKVLERILERDPATEVMLMTGQHSPESAVEAIRKGAADYLTKPLSLTALRERMTALFTQIQNRRRALQLDQELLDVFQFEGIVGRSPLMLDVFAMIRRVAPHFQTVLVNGETGTGKERVAHALHNLSPVAKKPFVVCNCAALTESLLESELFGHVRGAFTGAIQDKVGLFEYAQGGTVFLDEIGDMPPTGQAKLLRVLQNHELQRVGSPAVRHIEVHVIAATNRDLRAMVDEKKFREDLFYRLSMVEIHLPSLSERREDLPLLQRHFVEKFSTQFHKNVKGLTRRAQSLLSRHPWPGNVRELENVIGNACMMAESDVIDVVDLPPYVRASQGESPTNDEVLSIDELQRRHVINVVQRLGGNKQRAAEMLGISRTTLYSILNRTAAAN